MVSMEIVTYSNINIIIASEYETFWVYESKMKVKVVFLVLNK
jgi:hypothetical protein